MLLEGLRHSVGSPFRLFKPLVFCEVTRITVETSLGQRRSNELADGRTRTLAIPPAQKLVVDLGPGTTEFEVFPYSATSPIEELHVGDEGEITGFGPILPDMILEVADVAHGQEPVKIHVFTHTNDKDPEQTITIQNLGRATTA